MNRRVSRADPTRVLVLSFALCLGGCEDCDLPWNDCEVVNVEDIVWEAYANPSGFDAVKDSLPLHPRSVECLERLAVFYLAEAIEAFRRCDEITVGRTACRNEAQDIENFSVILRDIARALRGENFAATEAGQLLVFLQERVIRFRPGRYGNLCIGDLFCLSLHLGSCRCSTPAPGREATRHATLQCGRTPVPNR